MIRSGYRHLVAAAGISLLAACGGKDTSENAEPGAVTLPATSEPAAPAGETAPAPVPTMDATGAPATSEEKPGDEAIEKAIVEDARGQWATSAKASSTYRGTDPKESYSAWQATGAPDVPRYSDNALAWASKNSDGGPEWLEVGFGEAVHADGVRVRQNHAPGAIVRLELIDAMGIAHEVWQGVDGTRDVRDRIVWFEREFARTPYKVKGVRLTLASDQVWGWNEIDAVQLLNADAKTETAPAAD